MTEPLDRSRPADLASVEGRLAEAYRGELEIRSRLGVGGFAAVFRAHDPVLGRDVALKVVDGAAIRHPENRDQFLAEARVVATVEHPHIVPLYGAEVRGNLICLTMRLVPGRSLGDRIPRVRCPRRSAPSRR
jgi:eukaryotic-like serine/threonine-protein kinase